jgi:hypothetical protein
MKKFLIVSIAFVLSGCAAIRIDVDVYKGPLLNEQLVQQQQVVSMTLASKLILEAQRDDECKNQAHKVRCKLLNDAISLFDPISSQYASLVKRAEESIGLYTSSNWASRLVALKKRTLRLRRALQLSLCLTIWGQSKGLPTFRQSPRC